MSTSMIARATADRGRGTPGSTSGCAPTAAAGHGPVSYTHLTLPTTERV